MELLSDSPHIMRQLERGKVVLKIELDPSDIAATRRPPAFFVCFDLNIHFNVQVHVPRTTFLISILESTTEFFKDYVAPSLGRPSMLTLQYDRNNLNWFTPIGVLHDIYMGAPTGQSWSLTACTSYEGDGNGKIPSVQAFQSAYMGMLKLSQQIAHGNINGLNELDRRSLQDLQLQVEKGDRSVRLREFLPLSCSGLLKGIPIKLHAFNTDAISTFYKLCSVAPFRSESETVPVEVGEFLESTLGTALSDKVTVIVEGMPVPGNVPLIWLFGHARNVDGFLHVVLRGGDSAIGSP